MGTSNISSQEHAWKLLTVLIYDGLWVLPICKPAVADCPSTTDQQLTLHLKRTKMMEFEKNVHNPKIKKNNKKKPYVIGTSEVFGRYVMAAKNIAAGEIIVDKEEPIVTGPVQQSDPICLGCYASIKEVNIYRCKKCKWPICGESCSGFHRSKGHSLEECNFLSTSQSFDAEFKSNPKNVYNRIVPLRCLLLKKTMRSKWNTIKTMESHNELRKNRPNIWLINQKTVVDKINDKFDSEEIHTICGILEVNCFEVTVDDVSIRALYPFSFLFSHDCVPNTDHTNDKYFNLKIRASIPIRSGHPITISYAYTLQNTSKRREHINETKFFDCSCLRCADPTEFATNLSTIVCTTCHNASVVSSNPLDQNSNWRCTNKECDAKPIPGKNVLDLVNKLEAETNQISCDDLEAYENWLKKVSNMLHENHFLSLGVKYVLSFAYGKTAGYMIQDMDDNLLKRKIRLCEELLNVANVVEPGLTRLRGLILYELHAPIMMSISQKYRMQNGSKKYLKQSLRRVITCLEESTKILEFESENTTEGQVGIAARKALLATQDWEKIIKTF